MITVEDAFACAGERVWQPNVEAVSLSELDDDERVKFDYLDATIEAGIYSNFNSGRFGMFDIKIPADFASLRIVNALINHYETEGKWVIGVFAAETSGDLVTTFQIVFAPSSSERIPSMTQNGSGGAARIICNRNRAGLSRDIRILQSRLQAAGFRVEMADSDRPMTHRVPVQFHVENVTPDALRFSDRNIAIPNPELWVSSFHGVEIWTKTEHARKVFAAAGANVHHIGWASLDRLDHAVPRERTFLHICGSSHRKGTAALVSAWRPEWPLLTVVAQPAPWWKDLEECAWIEKGHPFNVRVIRGHLSDEHLRELQNRSLFHIYPSLYEGYGHALWEGLSCGSAVIVPKGSPYDEMGAFEKMDSRVGKFASNGLVCDREVSEKSIIATVENVLRTGNDYVSVMRQGARLAWETAREKFEARIAKELAGLPASDVAVSA